MVFRELPYVMYDRTGGSGSPTARYGQLEVATPEAGERVECRGGSMRRAGTIACREDHREHVGVPRAGCPGDAEHPTAECEEPVPLDAVTDRLRAGAELYELAAVDQSVVPRRVGRDPVIQRTSHRAPEPGPRIR
jgi:hypothetical protein